MANAIEIHKQRLAGNGSLKPRTKDYHVQRITALLKSWPELGKKRSSFHHENRLFELGGKIWCGPERHRLQPHDFHFAELV